MASKNASHAKAKIEDLLGKKIYKLSSNIAHIIFALVA